MFSPQIHRQPQKNAERSSPEINLSGVFDPLLCVVRVWLLRFAAERRRVIEPKRSREAEQGGLFPGSVFRPFTPPGHAPFAVSGIPVTCADGGGYTGTPPDPRRLAHWPWF